MIQATEVQCFGAPVPHTSSIDVQRDVCDSWQKIIMIGKTLLASFANLASEDRHEEGIQLIGIKDIWDPDF